MHFFCGKSNTVLLYVISLHQQQQQKHLKMKNIYYFASCITLNKGERFMKADSPRGARGFDTFDSVQLYASINVSSLTGFHPNAVHGSYSSKVELISNPLAEKAYMDSMDSDKKTVISNLKKIDIDFCFLDGYNSHLVEFNHNGVKFVATIKEATNIYDLERLLLSKGVELPWNFAMSW